MIYDFQKLETELKSKNAVPLIVLYGSEASGGGIDLDWLSTEAYDEADSQLKIDIVKALGQLREQLK